MNKYAREENESVFSVQITFDDVALAGIPCNSIQIKRSFDVNKAHGRDELEILFDGEINELVKERYEKELDHFIRDYIMPLETAKFFFFDAEKIIAYADSSEDVQANRQLSLAYSEVLGIKKYHDLLDELQALSSELTKKSACEDDKRKIIQLEAEIKTLDLDVEAQQKAIDRQEEQEKEFQLEVHRLEDRLIREGQTLSPEEVQKLRNQLSQVEEELKQTTQTFRDLLDKAPFAIAGNTFFEAIEQIELEFQYKQSQQRLEQSKREIREIISQFDKAKRTLEFDTDVVDAMLWGKLLGSLEGILNNYFNPKQEQTESPPAPPLLHNYLETQRNEIRKFFTEIKQSFKHRFLAVQKRYRDLKSELNVIQRKLHEAETESQNENISQYRQQKQTYQDRIYKLKEALGPAKIELDNFKKKQTTLKLELTQVRKRVAIAEQYQEKHKLLQGLIRDLKFFIQGFKREKADRFAKSIFEAMSGLMHKNLVTQVQVDVQQLDCIEIQIFGPDQQPIIKSSLSNGEKQLYATALLQALSQESGIDFPVFVDSPMQKLDTAHASNIITGFYPKVSKQVVIFPLLQKELTEAEYEHLRPYVQSAYLIDHKDGCSSFELVDVEKLFETFENKKATWTLT